MYAVVAIYGGKLDLAEEILTDQNPKDSI